MGRQAWGCFHISGSSKSRVGYAPITGNGGSCWHAGKGMPELLLCYLESLPGRGDLGKGERIVCRSMGRDKDVKSKRPPEHLYNVIPSSCLKYDSVLTRVSSLATDDTFQTLPDHAHDGTWLRNQTHWVSAGFLELSCPTSPSDSL